METPCRTFTFPNSSSYPICSSHPRHGFEPQEPSQGRPSCTSFLRCVAVAAILLVIVAVLVINMVLMIYSAVHPMPKPPVVYVESADLTTFELTSSSALRYNLTTGITFKNPNRYSFFHYRFPKVEGYYDNSSLGETQLRFSDQSYNVTTLVWTEMVGETTIQRGGSTADLFNTQNVEGLFDLELRIHGLMRYYYFIWPIANDFDRVFKFQANCSLPALPLHGNGGLLHRTKCKATISFEYFEHEMPFR